MNPSSDLESDDITTVYDVDNAADHPRRSNRILGRPPSFDLLQLQDPTQSNIRPAQQAGIISPPRNQQHSQQLPIPAMAPYNSNSSGTHSSNSTYSSVQPPFVIPPSVPHQAQNHNQGVPLPYPPQQLPPPRHQPPVHEVQIRPNPQNPHPAAQPRQIFPAPPPQHFGAGGNIHLQNNQAGSDGSIGNPPPPPPPNGPAAPHHSSSSSHQSSQSHQSSYPDYPAYAQQQHAVSNMQSNITNLTSTVEALQRNMHELTQFNQNTAARLTRIDEANNSIVEALNRNTETFRSFVRGDIGPIVAAHVDTALGKRKSPANDSSDSSSSAPEGPDSRHTGSTSTSVFEPPPPPKDQADPSSKAPPSAPPPPQAPTNQSSIELSKPDDLKTILQGVIKAVAPKEKLVLPKLSSCSKSAYASWKKESLITIKIHSSFSPFIVTSPINGRPTISPDISSNLRGTLYMSLSKALDTKVKTEIGWDTIDDSDGVAILDKLETELGLKQESTLDTIDLLTALNNTKKDRNENLSGYHRRFKHALEECRVNNVMPFDNNAVIILYLRNMKEKCLTQTILNLEQGVATDWSDISSLDEMHTKAKKYIKAYLSLHPSSNKAKEDGDKKSPRTTTPEEDEAYKKRVRQVMAGL